MRGSVGVAHYHFPRLWADRNDDDVYVFANGHVYDRTERRRSLRQLVGMMRREKSQPEGETRMSHEPPFVPLGDRVLVSPIQEDEVSAGGVIIPELARERPQRGTVVAVGPGLRSETGDRYPVDVEVGDVVVYSKYGGSELTLEGDEYVILREVDVLGKVA